MREKRTSRNVKEGRKEVKRSNESEKEKERKKCTEISYERKQIHTSLTTTRS